MDDEHPSVLRVIGQERYGLPPLVVLKLYRVTGPVPALALTHDPQRRKLPNKEARVDGFISLFRFTSSNVNPSATAEVLACTKSSEASLEPASFLLRKRSSLFRHFFSVL
jgi:hypothetical protein